MVEMVVLPLEVNPCTGRKSFQRSTEDSTALHMITQSYTGLQRATQRYIALQRVIMELDKYGGIVIFFQEQNSYGKIIGARQKCQKCRRKIYVCSRKKDLTTITLIGI